MEVTFNAHGMYVDIYTRYLDNIGQYQTALGDLFISTDGWNPAGTAPRYEEDNFYSGGECWEYALVMDSHSPNPGQSELSGIVSLYAVSENKNIVLSSAPSGYVYRYGQEVQYKATDIDTVLATGEWSIGNWGAPDADDFLRFVIDYDFGDKLGFHWTMTCGNDVIEGAAPVPEPATMLLLGTGLVCFAGFGRKRFFKRG
jgi:hypothetical protein